ncbi:MAG: hypothetical protein KF911_02855 [Pseudomonadales bacterium]|nr:hypothetical protein [Pseudomonadales bacterium]
MTLSNGSPVVWQGPLAVPFGAPQSVDDGDALPASLIGGKGRSLAEMSRMGLPVPPGFTIVAPVCADYLRSGWSDRLQEALDDQIRLLERVSGRRLGDRHDPLFVSVRSGSAVSMPGMMDTLLNLGLNDTTADWLRHHGDPLLAPDCLRTLQRTWQSATGARDIPDDPHLQIRLAVEAVFRSWIGDRAKAYRRIENIPESLGTAVTVQAMVFGNLDSNSCTGVVFSRNPASGSPGLYGDVLFGAQGEAVVSGEHQTQSVDVLGRRLPTVAVALAKHVESLERAYRDLVEVEFTVESGRLWILQSRIGKRSPVAGVRIAVDMAEDAAIGLSPAEAVDRAGRLLDQLPVLRTGGQSATPVAVGLGASPGIASGHLEVTVDAAIKRAETGAPVILARPETSPADIEGIAAAAGILTARGGLASHAAVVARGWGKPSVVGLAELEFHAGHVALAGRRFPIGTLLTIDGATGEVFTEAFDVAAVETPEIRKLRRWRDTSGGEPSDGVPGGMEAIDFTDDELLQLLLLKGLATLEMIADVLGMDTDAAATRLSALAPALDRSRPKFIRLNDKGLAAAAATIHAATARFGANTFGDMLDSFHDINAAFKALVTRWQVRELDGLRSPNDHSDAEYDATIVRGIQETDRALRRWLSTYPCVELFGVYLRRLNRSLVALLGGDHRYLASPRIDSYHNVWFELHEALIRLAGRTRTDEYENE